jgi:hypothetical protein
MGDKSMRTNTPEASFYYATIAESCFRRIARSHHSNAGGVLRATGRKYFLKAGSGLAHEKNSGIFSPGGGRAGAKEPRSLP